MARSLPTTYTLIDPELRICWRSRRDTEVHRKRNLLLEDYWRGRTHVYIASITLKNFRAFRDETTLNFGLFSGIVGRNDSGKSSNLHALDIFFNRSPDLDDFTIGTSPDEPIEITVRFADLPSSVQIEEGVDTTLGEERLLDEAGCLAVKKVYARWSGPRPPSPEVRLVAHDFVEADLQNLCSKAERDLNRLGEAHGLDFSRAGRGITNKSKRQALRQKAASDGTQVADAEYKISGDLWRCVSEHLPSFSLFVADWRLSEEETSFQNEFKGMADAITADRSERQQLEAVIEQHIDQEVNKIHRHLLRHTDEVRSLKIRPQFRWRDLVSFRIEATDRDGVPVLLRKRGAGLRRLLMVAYFQYLAEKGRESEQQVNHIFGIEEPETYLHPGAQRELLGSLRAVASANQVLLTTHSPVFAGAAERESLTWTRKTAGAVTITQGSSLNLEELARDLGVEPSDQIYGYRACVFVEGPDDILFLETVADKLKQTGRISATFSERQIGIIPVGGIGNLKHWVSRKALRALSRRYGVFVDSDRRSAQEDIRADRQRWKQECEADGAPFLQTRKREIENYLHPDVVQERTDKTVVIDDFSDVKASVGEGCIGVIQYMTAGQLLAMDRWVDNAGTERHELVELIQELLGLV